MNQTKFKPIAVCRCAECQPRAVASIVHFCRESWRYLMSADFRADALNWIVFLIIALLLAVVPS